jgi:hypothetical protein
MTSLGIISGRAWPPPNEQGGCQVGKEQLVGYLMERSAGFICEQEKPLADDKKNRADVQGYFCEIRQRFHSLPLLSPV